MLLFMKNIFLTALIGCLFVSSYGQKLARITLFANSNSDIITIEADQGLLINFSKEGNIISWGVEDYWGRLLKYMGRVDYYTANDDVVFRGKVRYIGLTQITYYASYDNDALKGKIKTVGSNNFDYYPATEDEATKGKIKSIETTPVSYYSSFDNEAFKGKFRTVGNSSLAYYASYDDKAFKGKIKSIDNISFSYYSSFDRKEYQGALKIGTYMHIINGIKYVVRN